MGFFAMKVDHGDRQVVSSGVTAKGTFAISQASQAHIMTILRDTLYSDKILAVLREYSSNAWDAHRMIGVFDKPIKVTLPVADDPTLYIRDFGPGMSPDDVFNTYTKYGESTKRGTNDAVGQMGIGSKSAFAYSDSFTVTSWNDGVKRVYVAVLDSTNVGEMQCLDEEPCDPNETGVEIQVPVRPADIEEFRTRAINLFRYFDPQPETNIPLPKVKRDTLTHGFISSDMNEWIAVMGCIPYRINLDQVQKELEDAGLWMPVGKIKGGLNFDIGAVDIAASREELKYSDRTRKAIVDKFVAMMDEHVERALQDLKGNTITDWEKRQRAYFMAHVIGFKLPKDISDLGKQSAELYGYKTGNMVPRLGINDLPVLLEDGTPVMDPVHKPAPTTFFFLRGNSDETRTINVTQGNGCRVVIKDDDRDFRGFRFGYYDYVVRPKKDVPLDDVRTELTAYLAEARLTGIPVHDLSTLNIGWTKPWEPDPVVRVKNAKHWTSAFKFKPVKSQNQHSDNWEACKWEASDDDVFVILSYFAPKGFSGAYEFYEVVEKDKVMANFLGVPFPDIYGYKTTEKKPVDPATVKGMEYKAWRGAYFDKAVKTSAKVKPLMDALAYTKAATGQGMPASWKLEGMKTSAAKLSVELPGHILTNFLNEAVKMAQIVVNSQDAYETLSRLLGTISPNPDVKKALADLEAKYPLIFKFSGLSDVVKDVDVWTAYVKTCDKAEAFDRQAEDLADEIMAEVVTNDDFEDVVGLVVDKAA